MGGRLVAHEGLPPLHQAGGLTGSALRPGGAGAPGAQPDPPEPRDVDRQEGVVGHQAAAPAAANADGRVPRRHRCRRLTLPAPDAHDTCDRALEDLRGSRAATDAWQQVQGSGPESTTTTCPEEWPWYPLDGQPEGALFRGSDRFYFAESARRDEGRCRRRIREARRERPAAGSASARSRWPRRPSGRRCSRRRRCRCSRSPRAV